MGKLFQSVCEDLREKIEEYIESNCLKPHDRLPSERELCDLFDANRTTLRESINHMRNEGLLYTIHGKGNFISPPKYREEAQDFLSFSAGWERDGAVITSKVISFGQIEAPRKIAAALKLRIGALCFRLKRVRNLDGSPIAIETAFLPCYLFPGLEQYNFEILSLYNVIERKYNIKLKKQTQSISIAKLTSEEAALLHVTERSAAFYFKGLTESADGTPAEYCTALYLGEKYKMVGILTADNSFTA